MSAILSLFGLFLLVRFFISLSNGLDILSEHLRKKAAQKEYDEIEARRPRATFDPDEARRIEEYCRPVGSKCYKTKEEWEKLGY